MPSFADTITGNSQDNTLAGGAGDDSYVFLAGWGVDTVNEAAGSDTVSFPGFSTAVTLTLSGSAPNGYSGSGTGATTWFLGINSLTGSPGSSDKLIGESVASSWTLGTGHSYKDTSTVTLPFAGFETLQGGSAVDTFSIETGITGSLNHKGGAGADLFKFTDGATLSGNIDGEGGSTDIDTLDYSLFTTGVVVNIQTAAVGIEKVIGGSGNDNLIGSSGNETLVGGAGNDTLDGGDGSDVLQGGAGDDSYVFDDVAAAGSETDVVQEVVGEGKDTLDFSRLASNNPVTVNLGKSTGMATHTKRTVNGSAKNVFETVFGGAGDDPITGRNKGDAVDKGADRLEGRDGKDTMSGLGGNDTIDGGVGDDSISGGKLDDELLGGDGNDTLDGDQHNDQLDGGAGNDSLFGDAHDDVLIGRAGNDTLDGGKGSDDLRADAGADTLTGGQGKNPNLFNCGVDNDDDTLTDFNASRGDTKNANCDD